MVKEHLETAFVVFSCWTETWAEKIGVFLLENVLWDCSVIWWVIVVLPTHTKHLPLISVMAVTLFSASCTSKKIIHHWRTPLPSFLQLDVSGDGVHDCIVRGSDTMLFMIEVHYGTILWHVHQHKTNSKYSCIEYQLMSSFTLHGRVKNLVMQSSFSLYEKSRLEGSFPRREDCLLENWKL